MALDPRTFCRELLETVQRDLFTIGAELAPAVEAVVLTGWWCWGRAWRGAERGTAAQVGRARRGRAVGRWRAFAGAGGPPPAWLGEAGRALGGAGARTGLECVCLPPA